MHIFYSILFQFIQRKEQNYIHFQQAIFILGYTIAVASRNHWNIIIFHFQHNWSYFLNWIIDTYIFKMDHSGDISCVIQPPSNWNHIKDQFFHITYLWLVFGKNNKLVLLLICVINMLKKDRLNRLHNNRSVLLYFVCICYHHGWYLSHISCSRTYACTISPHYVSVYVTCMFAVGNTRGI